MNSFGVLREELSARIIRAKYCIPLVWKDFVNIFYILLDQLPLLLCLLQLLLPPARAGLGDSGMVWGPHAAAAQRSAAVELSSLGPGVGQVHAMAGDATLFRGGRVPAHAG